MRLARTAPALLATTLLIAGCGESDYANKPRPPAPTALTAQINPVRVKVSPTSVGAGPITIILVNLTAKTHRITVESDELGAAEGGLRQQTAPINPQGTAKLNIAVKPGRYTIGVGGKVIKPATLKVGKERDSSQDQLLLP